MTLLRCINLLEPPEDGHIFLEGHEITPARAERAGDIDFVRRRVGIVFQQFNLFPHKSAIENVGARADARCSSAATRRRREKAESLLERVGLADKLTSTPSGSRAASSSGSRSPGRWRWTRT